jgi:hypothetical protein
MKRTRGIPGSQHALFAGLAALDREALQGRVRALAAAGWPDHDIARVLRLSALYVRQVLAKARPKD